MCGLCSAPFWYRGTVDEESISVHATRNPHRERSRIIISAAQPFARAWLNIFEILLVAHDVRIDSSEFLWALQRRLSLHITDAAPTLAALAATSIHHDPLGDDIIHSNKSQDGQVTPPRTTSPSPPSTTPSSRARRTPSS